MNAVIDEFEVERKSSEAQRVRLLKVLERTEDQRVFQNTLHNNTISELRSQMAASQRMNVLLESHMQELRNQFGVAPAKAPVVAPAHEAAPAAPAAPLPAAPATARLAEEDMEDDLLSYEDDICEYKLPSQRNFCNRDMLCLMIHMHVQNSLSAS